MTTYYLDLESGADGCPVVDSSSYAHVVNSGTGFNGDPTIYKFAPASAKFAGVASTTSQNGFAIASDGSFNFGAGDFTIEFWINPINFTNPYASVVGSNCPSWSAGACCVMLYGPGQTGVAPSSGSRGNHIGLTQNNGSAADYNSASALAAGTWYHVAFSKVSGNMYVFVNGTLENTYADTRTWDFGYNGFTCFGYDGWDGTNSRVAAYVDEFRVTKGVGRYTASFTVPTAPYDSSDTYFSSVVFLSHLSNYFVNALDESSYNKSTAPVGNAVTTTAQAKFGTMSLSNGANSGIFIPADATLRFGAGQFTMEAFIRPSASSDFTIMSLWSASTGLSYYFGYFSGGFVFWHSTDGVNGVFTTYPTRALTLNSWIHVAVDRDPSSTVRIYVDGVVAGTASITAAFDASAGNFVIGNQAALNSSLQGYIDAVRVTKGVARYAGAFTPPSSTYPTGASDPYWSSVSLLSNFEVTLAAPGLSYATRLKTIAAALGLMTNGDTLRLKASPSETLVGTATWTNSGSTVTLAGAVNADINTCEAVWTAVTANVSTTTTTVNKQGTKAAAITVAAAFTTGLAAYAPVAGTLPVDLSGYQQVSFWFFMSNTCASGTFSLRLCSDTAGATPLVTIPVPAYFTGNQWQVVTVNLGVNLPSSVQSVALYCDGDYSTTQSITVNFDNIVACKASSSPDSLTLSSLIGKACNTSWAPSTAYSLGDMRRPTGGSRTGFTYKVTTAGTSGATEPAWPQDTGVTVTDGTVVWTCFDLEETWLPIKSIAGTTVTLDSSTGSSITQVGKYYGASETVATYKREPVSVGSQGNGATLYTPPGGANANAWTLTSGGWNRVDMSTQSGETWIDMVNSAGYFVNTTNTWLAFESLGLARPYSGYQNSFNAQVTVSFKNFHVVGAYTGFSAINAIKMSFNNVVVANPNNIGIDMYYATEAEGRCVSVYGCFNGSGYGIRYGIGRTRLNYLNIKGNINGFYGYGANVNGGGDSIFSNVATALNSSWAVNQNNIIYGTGFVNSTFAEASPFAWNLQSPGIVWSHNHNGVKGKTYRYHAGQGVVQSVQDVVHTTGGWSWRFTPAWLGSYWFPGVQQLVPLRLSVAKIYCTAGVTKNVTIWTRRDGTNIKGRLVVDGGQVTGVPSQLVVDCQPAINTWVQSSTLSFTPLETGVVEIEFFVWNGVNGTENFWVDDVGVVSVVSGVTYCTWSPTDLSANMVLSNSNLTATGNAAADTAVRGTLGKLAGKYYFEFTTGAQFNGPDTGLGLALSTANLSTVGGTAASAVAVFTSGSTWLNGNSLGLSQGAIGANVVVGVAVDLDNKRIWFRLGAVGNWNNNAPATPATPSTGIDISSLSGALYPLFACNALGASVTANFGLTPFTGAVPAGFQLGWY